MKRGVVLRSAWRIARAYWFSREKRTAWSLLLVVIALNLGLVYIMVLINAWHSVFYQMIQTYNYGGFVDSILRFALLAALFIFVKGCQIYMRMLLHISWRRWLTEHYLSAWLAYKTYYRMQLTGSELADNPDQRISEDVELFVRLTLRLSLDLLQDAVSVLSFVFILWNLSGVFYLSIGETVVPVYGYLVWAAILYAGLGSYLTIRWGRPLVRLDYNQERYEADFRYSLVRIRENAESIALYAGEMQEKNNCLGHFMHIVENFLKIITIRRKLMWLTTAYSQVAVIFGILVAAPRYFSSQIHLGQMFQVIDAYNHVQQAFSFIIDSFTQLAQWRAVVNRLNNFLLCMEVIGSEPAALSREYSRQSYKIEYSLKQIRVFRPDGGVLVKDITLGLRAGQRLLVTGPSGCGKSTFLRTLAGLWPYAKGHLAVSGAPKTMFVPQKNYMPLATLRDVLVYPRMAKPSEDAILKKMLVACQLPQLQELLDKSGDWGQILSLGEQQRVAFVRVLLFQPDWLFLDEATSALDEKTESVLYALITRLLTHTAIVSVGHRNTLFTYHQERLELDGKGNWCLSRIR